MDQRTVRVAEHHARAHADELVDEEQPALVHLFVEQHGALGLRGRHQRHAHEIGGEGRPRAVVDRRDGVAEIRPHRQPLARGQDEVVAVGARAHAEPAEDREGHAQMLETGVLDDDLTAGHRGERDEAADLHEVGAERELRAAQSRHAVDAEQVAADAVDVRAHRRQQGARLLHVRLARGVAHDGGALRERGREHDVLSRRHAGLVQQDVGAAQRPAPQAEIAVLLQPRAESLQAEHVRIDAPAADLIAAGVADARLALAGEQRTHEDQATAHALEQRGVRRGRGDPARAQRHRVGIVAVDLHAEPLHQRQHGADVGDVGKVVETNRLVGEQRGGDQRKGGVLVAARRDRAPERHAAFDDELVHGHDDAMVRQTAEKTTDDRSFSLRPHHRHPHHGRRRLADAGHRRGF